MENWKKLPSNNMMGRLSWSKKLEVASTQLTASFRGCDRVAKVLTFRVLRGEYVAEFKRPIQAGS
ncbi:hypothetical protein A2U01_0055175 [Trifolium medium]|uniref:Uncharacterized protein n=1 Tax=Trifolium medium TaxID=97028 RepID=A0A392RCN5_9FABA|nr:hypothetical protein [Trifolium medium]